MPRRARRRDLQLAGPAEAPGFAARYADSWAVVVGIDRYENVNGLSLAVRDAQGMAELLVGKLGFSPEKVLLVLDPPPDRLAPSLRLHARSATKAVIEEILFNRLPNLAKPDDRVLVFYAGHGERREVTQAKQDSVGYLVPCDARPGEWNTFVEWEAVMRAGDYCRAKHMFYLLDACYGGIAASRAVVAPTRFSEDMLRARVRQVLTAGTARQTVADAGPHGHSLFTSYVLEGLSGAAAAFDRGTVTATELMVYVRNRVAPRADSKQTPAFSMLDTEPGGDFVFVLPPQKKASSDLARYVRILNQGPHGVPVSHAVVAGMEASLRRQGTPALLSPQKLVELGRILDSNLDASGGEYVKTIVNAAQALGVPAEKVQRRRAIAAANTATAKLPSGMPAASCNARCTRVARVDDIPDQLAQGRTVVLGLSWYNSMMGAEPTRTGEITDPPADDHVMGGHAVLIVGYDAETDRFKFANSWGRSWGQRGFGTLSRKVLEKLSTGDMFAIEATLFVWAT